MPKGDPEIKLLVQAAHKGKAGAVVTRADARVAFLRAVHALFPAGARAARASRSSGYRARTCWPKGAW